MRKSYVKTGAVVTAIALSISGTTYAEPLAPGKPAGVHQAQLGDKEWLVAGGLGLLVIAVVVANAGSGDHAAVTTLPVAVVNTTSTAI